VVFAITLSFAVSRRPIRFEGRNPDTLHQSPDRGKDLKPARHPIISLVVGILIALAIIAGMFFLLVGQQ
jgi:hypothetical protein